MKIYDIWLQLNNLAFCDSFQLVKGIKNSLISIPTDCSKRPYFSESSNWWANPVYFTTYEIYDNHYDSCWISYLDFLLFESIKTFGPQWNDSKFQKLFCSLQDFCRQESQRYPLQDEQILKLLPPCWVV